MKVMRVRRSGGFLVVAATALLLASCAVMLVGPYDEVTDRAVTDLAAKTELFFAKLQTTHSSYSANKSFYMESRASLAAIKLRASLYQKNSGELKLIDALLENFNNLEQLDKLGTMNDAVLAPSRTSIESNFSSLIQVELAKKRSSGISAANSS